MHHPTLRLAVDYIQRADAILDARDPTSANFKRVLQSALAVLDEAPTGAVQIGTGRINGEVPKRVGHPASLRVVK